MNPKYIFPLMLLLAALACQLPRQATPTPEPEIEATIPVAVPGPSPTFSPEPGPPASPTPLPKNLVRQGAAWSYLDPYDVEEVALSEIENKEICGDSYLNSLGDASGEIILTLSYREALLPEQIEIYTSSEPHGIRRIELFNSISGLGELIYESDQFIQSQTTSGPCAQKLSLSTNPNFEVDTVIIAFENPAAVAQLGAVEMLGRLDAYVELPVFWRVPLPNTAIALAVNDTGLVFVATEPNGLYTYDVEGNQLKQFPIPIEASLTDITTDPFSNMVAVDSTYGWYIVISPEGEHLTIGGSSVFGAAAVSPLDGNLYLLMGSQIQVHTTDTGEFLRQMPLDDLHTHTGLAFDPQGRLFTLRDYDWDATLLELDPLTGDSYDSRPLRRSNRVDTLARDLAFDANGNLYILFGMNASEVAVHMFAPDGTLLKRFAKLTYDITGRPEGQLFDPRAIAVSPDGRFIFIADGYEDEATLTAFLVEQE